jgi:acylphosphatase
MEIPEMQVQVHLMISGRVQGVGFRHYCVQGARQYGLCGWVRNSDDGCVEVMAEGEEARLKPFMCWCRRGPPAASVLACRESYAKPTGEFDAFEVAF